MTLHPDEQARELADEIFDRHPPMTAAEQRKWVAGLIAALLARVRQQALEEAAQICVQLFNESYEEGRIELAHALKRIRLRQAAGEGTK